MNPKLAEYGLPNSNPFEEGEVAYMCPGEEGGPPVPEDPHLSYQIPDSIFAGEFYQWNGMRGVSFLIRALANQLSLN